HLPGRTFQPTRSACKLVDLVVEISLNEALRHAIRNQGGDIRISVGERKFQRLRVFDAFDLEPSLQNADHWIQDRICRWQMKRVLVASLSAIPVNGGRDVCCKTLTLDRG